jgi:hypothetical protein
VIRPTLISVILALCLSSFSHSFAQTSPLCPEIPDGDQLTVEGVGVVRAASLDSENGFTKFINGCFERDGWALEAPVLTLEEATNTLTAQNAKIRAQGANGTVKSVVAKEENVTLETLVLTIDSSYKKSGLPSGTYNISAERGVLKGPDLTLERSVIDKITGGQISQRFTSNSAVFQNDTLVVTGLRNATSNIVLNASDATIQNGNANAQTVTGSLGRVSSNADLTFTARQAISNDAGVFTLQNTEIKIFGISIYLDSYTYDPAYPLEFPIVIGFGTGLNLGVSGLRILNGEEGRLTVIGNNLFSSSSATNLTLFLRGVKDGWSYFVGQDELAVPYNYLAYRYFRVALDRDPNTGFTATLNFNTGRRIADPVITRASGEERFGYAIGGTLKTDFGTFNYRTKLEYGHVWQDTTSATTTEIGKAQNQVFVRVAPSLSWGTSLAGFTFSAAAGINFTAYPFKNSDQFVLNANSSFNASYAVKINAQNWGSISSGISWLEAFGTNVFARYAVTPATTLTIGLSFTPPVGVVPSLGFQGINFSKPNLSFGFGIDLRKVAKDPQPFTSQSITANFDLDFYDGILLTDNFDRPFQTPFLSLTPKVTYDFITQYGEFGSSITIYSSSFGFVFGTYLTQQNLAVGKPIAGTGYKFSFGLKFR